MYIPEEFAVRMERLLGAEYNEFIRGYELPHRRGVRVNTLKLPLERADELGICGERSPFSPLGFYADERADSVGHMPYHHAGAFYSQEPSAMAAVTALEPHPGEYILDMCAAPGGKSTQIAALLDGKGLLYCNEYVRSRASILLSNIERMGVRNAVVTSLHPDVYRDNMAGLFDRVLVDAPCSGEGMFRRDERAVAEWSPEHVVSCAARQAQILDSACECVREGGVLVYSTCTFSPEENEQTVAAFLERHEDFSLEPIALKFGRDGLNVSDRFDTTLCRRIYPMDGGEGHFVARMRRDGDRNARIYAENNESDISGLPNEGADMLSSCLNTTPEGVICSAADGIYILPHGYNDMPRIPVIRAGVLAGELKKGRAEPTHALFMSRKPDECRSVLRLDPNGGELKSFLHGEEIDCPDGMSGFAAVCCGDIVTGFGKCSGGRLKNRYPKGLRNA